MLTIIVVSVWASVDQDLSDRIAAAVSHTPVMPLKYASEAAPFRAPIGFVDLSSLR